MRLSPLLLSLAVLALLPAAGSAQQTADKEKARVQTIRTTPVVKPVKPARPAEAAKSAEADKPAQPAPAARLRPGLADQVRPGIGSRPAGFKRELGVQGGMRFEQLRAMRLAAEAEAARNARPEAVIPQNKRDYHRQPADCDDRDRGVHPGQAEVCNFKDDNCDGQVDEGVAWTVWRDQDGDGFGDPAQPVQTCPVGEALADVALNNRDCDDTDRARNPSLGTCP